MLGIKSKIMKKIIVLGAGLVGGVIAKDLAHYFDVTSADNNIKALESLSKNNTIKTIKADLSSAENIRQLVKNFDIVVGAVPGFMGYNMLKSVIQSGKNIVDISFFEEDPFELHQLAIDNNVTAVTDCGVAPGMGNIILGFHNKAMEVSHYECLVGGLPKEREWPFEYKAVFSPIDVIEEYTRPARYIQNGQLVVREALSDVEKVNFKGIGTLESWNSDGLRTLAVSMKNIPNMIEKTLRYPGCVEYIEVLRAAGFFSYEELEINGTKIRPIDLTSKLLFAKWKMKEGEEDYTVMRITIKGVEKGRQKIYVYELHDKYDRRTNTMSMARTTGYTCSGAVRLLTNKKFTRKGICPPEYLGEQKSNFEFMLNHLKERNVIYRLTESTI